MSELKDKCFTKDMPFLEIDYIESAKDSLIYQQQARIAELEAEVKKYQLRDMTTAPRDGTFIQLFFCNLYEEVRCSTFTWIGDMWDSFDGEVTEEDDFFLGWMPLPKLEDIED